MSWWTSAPASRARAQSASASAVLICSTGAPVFITSLGFYITPALLGGNGTVMVSLLIYQQASRLLNWPLASAAGSVLLVVTCLLFLLYERAMRMPKGVVRA